MTQLSSRSGRSITKIAILGLLLTALQVISSPTSLFSPAHAEKNYKVTETAKPAPAGTFAAGAGGDGWGISVYDGKVYNIYHNSLGKLTLDCHNRTDGRPCWNKSDIKLAAGWTDVSYQIQNPANTAANTPNVLLPAYGPGQWIDPTTGMLYAYTVNQSGSTYTPGIVKVDLSKVDPTNLMNKASTFTALAPNTVSCTNSVGNNCLTPTIQLNRRIFSVNFANAVDTNKLMCYDVDLAAACSTNPISLTDATGTTKYTTTQVGTFGDWILIPISSGSSAKLDCIDSKTLAPCSGWVTPTDSSFSGNGAPFPMLNAAGSVTGVCVPDATIACYNTTGTKITTPTGLTTVMPNKSGSRNGTALVVGTRVFVPTTSDNMVHCIDWAVSGLACTGTFPFNAGANGASSVYTVGADSNDPTCVWLNSDSGTANYTFTPPGASSTLTIAKVGQIQSFDAYSGNHCGSSGTRILLQNFLAPGASCAPLAYISLQLSTPNDPSFNNRFTGTVTFLNPAGNQLKDASNVDVGPATISDTGTVNLPANINNLGGVVPTISIALSHESVAYTGDIAVAFTWTSTDACVPPGYSESPYNVIFDVNGATLSDTRTLVETVTQGAILNSAVLSGSAPGWHSGFTAAIPAAPTPSGGWSAPFLGWFTAPSGGTQVTSANSNAFVVNGNTTFYAQWTLPTFLAIFDANGGTSLSPNSESITVGSDLSGGSLNVGGALPVPTWGDGSKVFTGWYQSSGGTDLIDETFIPSTAADGTITFYAHWATAIVAITNAATSVTGTSATLNGAITTANPNEAFFCFDNTSFTAAVVTQNPTSCNSSDLETLTAGPAGTAYTFNMTGLTAGTTYYYMQIGIQYGSVFNGVLQTFTTTSSTPPAPTPPAPTPLLTPTIVWPNPTNQVGPYSLTPSQLNAVCSVAGSVMTYTPALGTVLQPGTYTLSVTCTPPAGSGYGPLTTTVPFTVTRPTGVITWPTPTPIEGPARLDPTALNAVCSIPGATLTYDPSIGTVMSVGTHILHVVCTPPAGSPYLPLNSTVELIVKEKVTPPVVLDPPVNPTAQIVQSQFSKISWQKSPNGIAYFVTLDGNKICTTSALTCTVKKLVGPASDIKIYATKGNLTSTYVVPTIIRGTKPQVIGIVFFDTAKYNIRADQKAEIIRVAGLLKKLGYTDVVIGGHTDTNAYDNLTLSNNRAISTKNALAKLVSGLSFNLHYSGATEPMATNSTISGQAKNRRAEISVW